MQSSVDISSDNVITLYNNQRHNKDHHLQHPSQSSPGQEKEIYHQEESEVTLTCPQRKFSSRDHYYHIPKSEHQPTVIKTTDVTDGEIFSAVGRTAIQRNQRILKKEEISDLQETADENIRVKRRKGRYTTDKQKVYNICRRSKGKIGFKAERIKDRTFAIKQDDSKDSPEGRPLFCTTIRNNDSNKSILDSVNYFVLCLSLSLCINLCIISTTSQIV